MGGKINKPNQKGFTIIEVVLVLAIAGLIFIAVFVALPELQRSQRDNHRKNDIGLTIAAIRNYMVDHRNQLPPDSGKTSSGQYYDMNGDGIISEDEKKLNWQDGNMSVDLAPYLDSVMSGGVTNAVSVFDTKGTSSLYVTIGDKDKAGLITVFLGSKCPTTYPRPDVMSMELTGKTSDIAVFRYLENGRNYCENF